MMAFRSHYGDDPNQFGDLRGAGPGAPVAIVIHGGFWRAAYGLDHIERLAEALPPLGIATWNVEYRRIGQPDGGWPGTVDDVERAAAHLGKLGAEHGLDLARVIAIGHSAGGHLALSLAARKPIPLRGVISLAGVADLRRAWELQLSRGVVREFLGAAPEEDPERCRAASPIDRLPFGVRQLLVHGDRDETVPIEISRRHVEAARALGDDARLITLAGAGHMEVIDPGAAVWHEIEDAVRELIGERAPAGLL
ncbi:MAG: alpha/beta hydrolase family protein [Bryobacteraceae bacterium]